MFYSSTKKPAQGWLTAFKIRNVRVVANEVCAFLFVRLCILHAIVYPAPVAFVHLLASSRVFVCLNNSVWFLTLFLFHLRASSVLFFFVFFRSSAFGFIIFPVVLLYLFFVQVRYMIIVALIKLLSFKTINQWFSL